MKLTKTILFAAAVAATLAVNYSARANEPPDATSATPSRGILANPRALEEFPWLAQQSSMRNQSMARSEDVLADIKKNRALAASPRKREQFPELTRGGQLSSVASSKSGAQANQFAGVTKNRVPADSPRAREEFPWLARGYASDPSDRSFNVAPLK